MVILKSFLVSADVLSAGEPESDKSIGYGQETVHCFTDSEFFTFQPARRQVGKALESPGWACFLSPMLSPLVNTVGMMEEGNLYLSLSSLSSVPSSAVVQGSVCRGKIRLEAQTAPAAPRPSVLPRPAILIGHCALFLFPGCRDSSQTPAAHQPEPSWAQQLTWEG